MTSELIYTAGIYTGDGISVTLCDDRKVSIGRWKELQSRMITKQELKEYAPKAKGIAIICGRISGSLEVIDVDCKYDTTGTLFDRLMEAIGKDLASMVSVAKTISGGYHLYYRCSKIDQNLKLAQRPATPEETKANPHVKVLVLIETRGEGGYVVAPPSPGYEWIHNDHSTIPTITPTDRDFILNVCKSFNEYLDAPQLKEREDVEKSFGLSPIDDYNIRGNIIPLLEKHGWKRLYDRGGKTYFRRPGKDEGMSGDYWHEKRWFSVFTTSSEFEPMKAYNHSAVYCHLECNGDWTKTVQKLAGSGFGEDIKTHSAKKNTDSFIKMMRDKGMDDDAISDSLIAERGLKLKEVKDAIKKSYIPEKTSGEFWSRNDKDKLIINKPKLLDFLVKNGFNLMAYDQAGNDVRLVNVTDYIIEESSNEKAKKCLYEYAKLHDSDVATWILEKHALISESFLEYLPKIEPNFLTDTPDTALYPFRNGVVKVTKDGSSIVQYGDLKKHIWRSSLINRDIELVPMISDGRLYWGHEKTSTDIFAQFVYLICNRDPDRFRAVCTHIGYILHKFKDPTRPYAIILAEETDDEMNGGGTGKGIFGKAMSYLLQTENVDGKNFKLDKSFAWQRVSLDTRLVIMQDIRKNVDFEGFYSMLTEGLTVEKKGQNELFIPFEKSPKFLFTTNYMVPDQGQHAQRRQRVIPFGDFFGADNTPLSYFGHQLFTGWDEGEWKCFYNYLFACIQMYLNIGIIQVRVTESMQYKALKTSFGNEFVRFWKDIMAQTEPKWVTFSELFDEFLAMSDFKELDFSKKRFKKALTTACDAFQVTMETRRDGDLKRNRVKFTRCTRLVHDL